MVPETFIICPQTFITSRKSTLLPQNIFSVPENIQRCPENHCVACANLLPISISGKPVCRLQGSDALAAAPAPQSEIQTVCHCSRMTTTTGWGEGKYLHPKSALLPLVRSQLSLITLGNISLMKGRSSGVSTVILFFCFFSSNFKPRWRGAAPREQLLPLISTRSKYSFHPRRPLHHGADK